MDQFIFNMEKRRHKRAPTISYTNKNFNFKSILNFDGNSRVCVDSSKLSSKSNTKTPIIIDLSVNNNSNLYYRKSSEKNLFGQKKLKTPAFKSLSK